MRRADRLFQIIQLLRRRRRAVTARWLAEQPAGWVPQLNDQDVFNAVFAKLPAAVHALPCEWNLQYHAYMAQMRICGENQPLNCDAALQKVKCQRRDAAFATRVSVG